jgi:hypothetical protein
MDENQARENPSLKPAERCSEEMSALSEEPPQRWRAGEAPCLTRNEKIRLVALGLGLLALLVGFLLYLSSGTVLPLFGTMVVAFLGYRRLDARLDTEELYYL